MQQVEKWFLFFPALHIVFRKIPVEGGGFLEVFAGFLQSQMLELPGIEQPGGTQISKGGLKIEIMGVESDIIDFPEDLIGFLRAKL